MKLTELFINQRIVVQLCWGARKIEFYSDVIECNNEAVYVTPYLHKDSPLEINVTLESGVVCNLFTDEPVTNKRISWKNVELTTVARNGQKVYCIRAHSFNIVAMQDDRRFNERIVVQAEAKLSDGITDGYIDVMVHDISTFGLSFRVTKDYIIRSQQVVIEFTDHIDEKSFDVRLECTISRVTNDGDYNIVGCRIIGESKDYQIYEFLKRLRQKNHNRMKIADAGSESIADAKDDADNADADKDDVSTEDVKKEDVKVEDSDKKDSNNENSEGEEHGDHTS